MSARAPRRSPARGADVAEERQLPERRSQEELIMGLERDQFVAETSRPVPRARLGPRAMLGLWTLRAFALLVGLIVVYTFIAELHS